ncbi:MAG: YCF48-related protein [bacterium]|nr:YCF48-related protein [bacterium]
MFSIASVLLLALFAEWRPSLIPLRGGMGNEIPYIRTCDVYFLKETQKGWIAGFWPQWSRNSISHTTDGGKTWVPQETPSYKALRVFFINEKYGWAAGGGYPIDPCPIVMRTTDGGETWTEQILPGKHNLWAIHFIDPLCGWTAGLYGLLFHTIDGGITWESLQQNENWMIANLFFANHLTGWASGYDASEPHDTRGRIWKTIDGGQNWTQLSVPLSEDIFAMFFIDSLKGWFAPASYSSTPYYTTDGGSTWNPSVTTSVGPFPTTISFADSLNGWIGCGGIGIGREGWGAIWHTSDGGRIWTRQHCPTSHTLWSVSALNANEACAVGCMGTILRTEDGGNNWVYENNGDILCRIHAVDSSHIWACGLNSLLIRSENGGNSWEVMTDSGFGYGLTFPDFRDVFFLTPDIGWIGGVGGLYHTRDGGQTWETKPYPHFSCEKLEFVDTLHGWNINTGYGSLFYTIDGGTTWGIYDFPYNWLFNNLDFVDPECGWAVGVLDSHLIPHPLVIHTTDGGETWTRQPVSTSFTMCGLYACHFVSRTTGWAVGHGYGRRPFETQSQGVVFRTTNGGESWEEVFTVQIEYDFCSVGFADSLEGWVLSSWRIYHSTDGGMSFEMEFGWPGMATSPPWITAVDNRHAWVGWFDGCILEYVPSPGVDEEVTKSSPTSTIIGLKVVPNPFNRTVEIRIQKSDIWQYFSIATLQIYDLTGRLVKSFPLLDSRYSILNSVTWDGTDESGNRLPSGIYFCKLRIGDNSLTKQLLLLR